MLINNFNAIRLRNRAEDAKRARKEWEKVNREIEDAEDKIDLLHRACTENPFVAAVAPVADIQQYFENLLVKRHVYADLERKALDEIADELLRLVPLSVILGDETESEVHNAYQ
ncbi:MAG: hypothetical protein IJR52_04420 [Selenomonadaceae bacterium]|nr:hypothetical protein [Selenomonadaceae bacterium]MBR0101946.1 hypothetical protein [Selenomonadaceae bacterium]